MPCPYIIRGTIDSPSFRKKGCRNATGKMNYCTAFISISYPLRVLPLNQEGEFFIPDGRSYKARTMVLSKKNRHRKQHSVNPCRMQAIVRGMFEDLRGYNFSYIAAQIKVRSTLQTAERIETASEERTSDIACKAIHEQEE